MKTLLLCEGSIREGKKKYCSLVPLDDMLSAGPLPPDGTWGLSVPKVSCPLGKGAQYNTLLTRTKTVAFGLHIELSVWLQRLEANQSRLPGNLWEPLGLFFFSAPQTLAGGPTF